MKSKSLKLSTLCLMIMGGYQGVAADTQVQLLQLFKASPTAHREAETAKAHRG